MDIKWQQAYAWQSKSWLLQPKTGLPLSSAPPFFQVQCLTKLVKVFNMPKLKNIKLTTKAETEETTRGKTYLFHLFFTCNLGQKNLHHTALSRLRATSTFPKVSAAAQVSIDPSHKCHHPREHTTVQKDWSPEESSFATKQNTGKSQWIEKR